MRESVSNILTDPVPRSPQHFQGLGLDKDWRFTGHQIPGATVDHPGISSEKKEDPVEAFSEV